jgi:hypothetical protein
MDTEFRFYSIPNTKPVQNCDHLLDNLCTRPEFWQKSPKQTDIEKGNSYHLIESEILSPVQVYA